VALATPFFIVFGALSDRIGRKPVMMAGNLIAAVFTIPIFVLMYRFTPAGGSYNPVVLTFCVFLLVLFVTMVYGPIAAFLVESFPARVRYTSVSLPYHVGNGYFGGFLPFIATAVAAGAAVAVQNAPDSFWAGRAQYARLIYPIAVAVITFVIGTWLLKETYHNSIDAEVHEPTEARANPLVLGILIGLTVAALVLADQFLLPTVTPAGQPPYVQTAFRFLALAIVLVVAFVVFSGRNRRRRQAAGAPAD
jgi:MFS family permease